MKADIQVRWLASAIMLAGVSAAFAQSAPGAGASPEAGPAPAAAPADPTRLPGDNPPPSGRRMGPPPGAAVGRPPPEAGSDAPSPPLALALEAAQAALAACAADGYKVGVSVIDSAGQPRVALSADGATGGHVYTGVRKGLAALAFKTPTSQVAAKLNSDASAAGMVKPNMTAMAGAVPLMSGGQVIGAIGVSGASSQQDEKCAAAGAEKIRARLK
jgi:uncharacterized protein GlcG (DUF336 family)